MVVDLPTVLQSASYPWATRCQDGAWVGQALHPQRQQCSLWRIYVKPMIVSKQFLLRVASSVLFNLYVMQILCSLCGKCESLPILACQTMPLCAKLVNWTSIYWELQPAN
jgi:hypothetical protein